MSCNMVSVLVTLHPDNQLLHLGCSGTVMVCNTLQHSAHTQTSTDFSGTVSNSNGKRFLVFASDAL